MTIDEMKTRIRELEAMEVVVETNAGTYGAAEAQRAVGSAEPQHAEYSIMERVAGGAGARRRVGCDPALAPGRARTMVGVLLERRDELRRLRSEVKKLTTEDARLREGGWR